MVKYNPDISDKFFVGRNDSDSVRAVRNRIYSKTGNEMGVRPSSRPRLDRKTKDDQPKVPGKGTPESDNID